MAGSLIGEQFNKILAERTGWQSKMKIENRPEITDITKGQFGFAGEKRELVGIQFKFTTSYGEKVGQIVIDGTLFYVAPDKEMNQLVDEWKKNKEIKDDAIRLAVMNRILELAFLQAIPLSHQVKLPPPLSMPRVEPTKSKA
ncbi:MAG: hypothetical protein HYT16_04060 [DPANN group archaeon]|nr:hypothetical protein [DPANN group archaeon]